MLDSINFKGMDNLNVEFPVEIMKLLRRGDKVVVWDREVQKTITIKYEDV